jgi:hypothetical protein
MPEVQNALGRSDVEQLIASTGIAAVPNLDFEMIVHFLEVARQHHALENLLHRTARPYRTDAVLTKLDGHLEGLKRVLADEQVVGCLKAGRRSRTGNYNSDVDDVEQVLPCIERLADDIGHVRKERAKIVADPTELRVIGSNSLYRYIRPRDSRRRPANATMLMWVGEIYAALFGEPIPYTPASSGHRFAVAFARELNLTDDRFDPPRPLSEQTIAELLRNEFRPRPNVSKRRRVGSTTTRAPFP